MRIKDQPGDLVVFVGDERLLEETARAGHRPGPGLRGDPFFSGLGAARPAS